MILAGLDLGSRWQGLAAAHADLSSVCSAEIDLDPLRTLRGLSQDEQEPAFVPLLAACVDVIMQWLAAVGAEHLAIEFGPFYPGRPRNNTKQEIDRWAAGVVERQRNHAIMGRVAVAVEAACKAATPPIPTRRLARNKWAGAIGAKPDRGDGGKSLGVKDPAVRAALVAILGEDTVNAALATVHRRDAMGVLLGCRALPVGDVKMRGQRGSDAYRARQLESGRRRAKASALRLGPRRKAERAAARTARGQPPLGHHVDRALALLAGCPGGARARWLAAQLGIPPTQVAAMFAGALRRGQVTQPERGVYALAPIST